MVKRLNYFHYQFLQAGFRTNRLPRRHAQAALEFHTFDACGAGRHLRGWRAEGEDQPGTGGQLI